jgi:hypothetical protein
MHPCPDVNDPATLCEAAESRPLLHNPPLSDVELHGFTVFLEIALNTTAV